MKTFYLLRHEDVHGQSGTGVVAEGVVFDEGPCAMTWLSKHRTVTVFDNVKTVKELHGHGGLTEMIIEGQDERFEDCKSKAREKRRAEKRRKKDVSV